MADKFPGWESISAMKEHIKFVRDHHKYVKRIAVVSDSKVMEIFPTVAAHFIDAGFNVREFPKSRKAEAVAWAQTG